MFDCELELLQTPSTKKRTICEYHENCKRKAVFWTSRKYVKYDIPRGLCKNHFVDAMQTLVEKTGYHILVNFSIFGFIPHTIKNMDLKEYPLSSKKEYLLLEHGDSKQKFIKDG